MAEVGLPKGWKVEVRVRKTGKRDRYYTDPVSGYVFRSLKDINRYLLSGALGKRGMKNKSKDAECSTAKTQVDDVPETTKKRKENFSAEPKKVEGSSKRKKSHIADQTKKMEKAPTRKKSEILVQAKKMKREKSNNISEPDKAEASKRKTKVGVTDEPNRRRKRISNELKKKTKKRDILDGPKKVEAALMKPISLIPSEMKKVKEGSNKMTKLEISNQPKKSCPIAKREDTSANGGKKQVEDDQKLKDKIDNRKKTGCSKKKEPKSFFIEESDQVVEASSDLDPLDVQEIIESLKRLDEDRDDDTVYISASEIASLLGRHMSKEAEQNDLVYNHPAEPQKYVGICDDYNKSVDCEDVPLEGFHGQENHSRTCVKTQARDVGSTDLTFPLGYLCFDPCIEFAIKMLTGAINPLAGTSNVSKEEHYSTDQSDR